MLMDRGRWCRRRLPRGHGSGDVGGERHGRRMHAVRRHGIELRSLRRRSSPLPSMKRALARGSNDLAERIGQAEAFSGPQRDAAMVR